MSMFRILVLVLLVNAIKIPPEAVPTIVTDSLSGRAYATPWLIVVAEDVNTPEVLEHEYCHIRQMNRYGSVWFSFLNGYENIVKGYWNNKFERECYKVVDIRNK